jgi:hypothetical protein
MSDGRPTCRHGVVASYASPPPPQVNRAQQPPSNNPQDTKLAVASIPVHYVQYIQSDTPHASLPRTVSDYRYPNASLHDLQASECVEVSGSYE